MAAVDGRERVEHGGRDGEDADGELAAEVALVRADDGRESDRALIG